MSDKESKTSLLSWLRTILIYACIGLTISLVVRIFVEPTIVIGNSMDPTLKEGSYMLNLKTSYDKPEDVEYEDIVIVTLPNDNRNLIKRVIGKPNDIVEIKDNQVYINGEKIDEPYIKEPMVGTKDMKVELNDNQIFVMGDNRNNSLDSRMLGPVDLSHVRGEIILQIYPFN